jgi:hypothetical protein
VEYWLIATLHPSQAEAEARFEELLRRFVVADGEPMPPRHEWSSLIDGCGENPHIYKIRCDGQPAEEIDPFSEPADLTATA